jgi:hypothetical protein
VLSASAFFIITDDPISSAIYDRHIPKIRIIAVIFVQSKILLLLSFELLFKRDKINSDEIFVDGPITTSATTVPAENPRPFSATANDTIPCSQIVMGRVNMNRPARLAMDFITDTTSVADEMVTEDADADEADEVGGAHTAKPAEITTPTATQIATCENKPMDVLINNLVVVTMLVVLVVVFVTLSTSGVL